ncbi:MAG: protein kinase [Gemmatimonadales bacterium]
MTISRLTDALADRYLIARELGAGGMATVYLAHDLRHDRQVAIKVLRPELAAVIGAERFLSEIKTTANLQHPHILPLFDSGASDSFLFYVMPYVEGESLRDRLERERQLPVDEAVRLATEIAGALDYAHRQGIVHRDIKPENVLLHDGQALVADFGIALAMAKTTGTRMTETGMSLGTPHYMSPEQAMGEREITARSDVYALGAITYEMLCGEPPFTGPTAQSIIARVMTEEPRSLTGQRKSVSRGIEAAVFTALEKLPADRYATAAQFAAALKNPSTMLSRDGVQESSARGKTRWLIPAGAALGSLLVGGILGRSSVPAAGDAVGVVRANLSLGDSVMVRPEGNIRLAISPDGKRIAFTSVSPNSSDRFVRVQELNGTASLILPSSKGAGSPFFSPDGESIGFILNNGGTANIVVASLKGGTTRTVVSDSVSPFGADWGDDGNIYFTHADRGLARVSAQGGKVEHVSIPDSSAGTQEHDYPDVLPGSKYAVVMMWKGSIGTNAIGVVDLATGVVTELTRGTYARFLAPGHLLIGTSEGTVLAARLDPRNPTTLGSPSSVVPDVQREAANGTVQFAVAGNGTLVYQPNLTGDAGLVWVDRDGAISPVDSTLRGLFSSLSLSPDGRAVALTRAEAGDAHIWVKQLPAGAFTKVSQDVTSADRPVWSLDGRTVAFLATRNGRRTSWIRRADASDEVRPAVPGSRGLDEILFHPDGKHVLLRTEGSASGTRHMLVMEPGVDTIARKLIESRFDHYSMAISPDGRWLAYVSEESGAAEVYVRPFPDVNSSRTAISVGGGTEPVWRRDGRELFFRGPRGELFSSAVLPGPTFSHESPVPLFSATGLSLGNYYRSYDVSADGKRFMMIRSGGGMTSELRLIVNFRQELDALTKGAP